LTRSRSVVRLWAVAVALLFVGCGSNKPKFNATPTVTQLFPSVITAGSDGFVMSVMGTGFISSSAGTTVVNWNGSPRSTTFNQSTGQLAVQITAADVANPTSVIVTATNPAPGGGTSATGPAFTIEPVHAGLNLITLDPSNASAGGDAFTLTVNAGVGTVFAAGDVINWNGGELVTTVTPPSQATAQITKEMIHTAGAASVNVSTADPTVATLSTTFTINAKGNAMAIIQAMAPSTVAHGASDFEMRVTGSGFAPGAVVLFNGKPRATSFLSSSELIVLIPASDVTDAGNATIAVRNPALGGSTSTTELFRIE